MSVSKPPVVFLMGPTASGKTQLAIDLRTWFPLDIISVDSVLIYKGLNIGSAKPDEATLLQHPHQLVNILEPHQNYSVAEFMHDALAAIQRAHLNNRVPILVGGTMMYFKALLTGMDNLPSSDPTIRRELQKRMTEEGLLSLHQQLQTLCPQTAARLHPNDQQRVLRALEVCLISGEPMAALQAKHAAPMDNYAVLQLALIPRDRTVLHQRIEQRFKAMCEQGLVQEVKDLMAAGTPQDCQSLATIGYRQVVSYLSNEYDYATMLDKGIIATRQFAKRQLTWLRGWSNCTELNPDNSELTLQAKQCVQSFLSSIERESNGPNL